MNVEPAPSKRVLIILKAVMEARTVRFSDLVEYVPVSRSGTWRALEVLVEMGLITRRNGDGRYRLTEEAATLFGQVEAPHAGADDVTKFMGAIKETLGFDVDFGSFISLGRFEIVESTRAEAYEGGVLSLIFDDLCIAAQSIASMRQIIRHVETYQSLASPMERQILRQGKHARIITAARQDRIIWGHDGSSFSVGVLLPNGSLGAFRFHIGRSSYDSLLSAAQTIPKGAKLEDLQQWIVGEKQTKCPQK